MIGMDVTFQNVLDDQVLFRAVLDDGVVVRVGGPAGGGVVVED